MANIASALDVYRIDNGAYPTTEQGLAALAEEANIAPIPLDYQGPYVKSRSSIVDSWRWPLQYRWPGVNDVARFDLWSWGADGLPGGEGDDADLIYGVPE